MTKKKTVISCSVLVVTALVFTAVLKQGDRPKSVSPAETAAINVGVSVGSSSRSDTAVQQDVQLALKKNEGNARVNELQSEVVTVDEKKDNEIDQQQLDRTLTEVNNVIIDKVINLDADVQNKELQAELSRTLANAKEYRAIMLSRAKGEMNQ